jgi:hypothetical protein
MSKREEIEREREAERLRGLARVVSENPEASQRRVRVIEARLRSSFPPATDEARQVRVNC